ncbi:ribosome biogenesis GTPase Der, partial [Francisella tularensis subsp. holarctica]|nr:ribosome biogenesis GTPase Der [Francisella tularensis subsp. holarctica]
EKFSVIKTLQAIPESNVVVAGVDARHGISDQDLSLIHFAIKNGRALVLDVNKWDGMTEEDRIQVKQDLKIKLFFLQDYVDIHFISSLYGTNVGH